MSHVSSNVSYTSARRSNAATVLRFKSYTLLFAPEFFLYVDLKLLFLLSRTLCSAPRPSFVLLMNFSLGLSLPFSFSFSFSFSLSFPFSASFSFPGGCTCVQEGERDRGSVAHSFSGDGRGSQCRSALRQGPVSPLRVHHRSLGVLAVSPLPRSGCVEPLTTRSGMSGERQSQ